MAIIQKKTKTVIKGRPLGGAIGAYGEMEKKAKAGDAQAQADLKLEKAKYKTFGDGPGSGPSGAMPKPKKKMGGAIKKAQMGTKLTKPKAGEPSVKDVYDMYKTDQKRKPMVGIKKAKAGFDLNKDGKTTFKDVLIGRGVLPKTAKKGVSVKKCKYGCK